MSPAAARAFPAQSLPDGFRLIDVPQDRADEFRDVDEFAFGVAEGELVYYKDFATSVDWSRCVGVETTDHRLVAIHASLAFDLPVPGGRVPASGLTFVAVHPTFRRRGLLRAMMARHFSDCVRRNEPVSILTASEPVIYPRFGYQRGNWAVHLTLPAGAALRQIPDAVPVTVDIETASLERHMELASAIQRRAGFGPGARPGWTCDATPGMSRWRFSVIEPSPLAERPRIAIAGRDGVATGFALFRRVKDRLGDAGERVCEVLELVATDASTHRALWSTLTNFDLVQRTTTARLALDDPLLALLKDPVTPKPTITDDLYVRLIDVPAALAARRYAAPLDMVLEVTDPLISRNTGRWRIVGSPFSTRVEHAGLQDADLALDVGDLSSLYLGGMSLMSLFDAGLIDERKHGSVERLAASLAWPRLPGESRGF
ncbi:MAG: GNAT family N-acetyltransferase [Micrococcales bacterium]|nr:GNAT family N-acetyltransferase [Micrococcales bacterium]